MEVTKTYRNLIGPIHSTHIEVKGKRVDISFRSGGRAYPQRVNGTFATSDPDLIEALDNDPRNGKDWVCISDTSVREEKPMEELTPKAELIEVKDFQEAKEWLVKNKEVPRVKLPNPSAITNKAKELNIEFKIV